MDNDNVQTVNLEIKTTVNSTLNLITKSNILLFNNKLKTSQKREPMSIPNSGIFAKMKVRPLEDLCKEKYRFFPFFFVVVKLMTYSSYVITYY